MRFHTEKRSGLRAPVSCAVYYSNGAFHASGMTSNLTQTGGCLHGTHTVRVGMELMVLLIPPTQKALLIKKVVVRWVKDAAFGVELDRPDHVTAHELDQVPFDQPHIPLSFMTH